MNENISKEIYPEVTDPVLKAMIYQELKNKSRGYDHLYKRNIRYCELFSFEKEIAKAAGYTEKSYNAQFAPDVPRFSITHIKKVFREVYNMEVVDLTVGYKAGRYQRFREYALKYLDSQEYVRGKDGKVFRYYMHTLGQYLVNNGDY